MPGRTDTDRLGDLLARERRLAHAYEAALRGRVIAGDLGAMLLAHERGHVRALEHVLGAAAGDAATARPSELTAALRDRRSFADYALRIEDETVGLYADAVAREADPKLRQPLGSIMVCGTAHVVALRDVLGRFLVT
jgi:Ferritin-like domain